MSKELTLASLGTEINDLHAKAMEHAGQAIMYAVTCGERLIEAKAKVPHGQWLPWLRENVQFSERTAQGYMRIAKNQKRNGVADLSLRQALEHLAEPKPEPRTRQEWAAKINESWRAATEAAAAMGTTPEAVVERVEAAAARLETYLAGPATSREEGIARIRDCNVVVYLITAKAYKDARDAAEKWPKGKDAAWADAIGLERGQAAVLSRIYESGGDLYAHNSWAEAREAALSTITEDIADLQKLEREISAAQEDEGE